MGKIYIFRRTHMQEWIMSWGRQGLFHIQSTKYAGHRILFVNKEV